MPTFFFQALVSLGVTGSEEVYPGTLSATGHLFCSVTSGGIGPWYTPLQPLVQESVVAAKACSQLCTPDKVWIKAYPGRDRFLASCCLGFFFFN